MKIIKNIKTICGSSIMMVALAMMSLNSCTENIDESDLYTFTGEMMIDYFENRPEKFSSYLEVLGKVHPSKRSESTMKELLAARGNYTCFAPTNEAIQAYLDSLQTIGQLTSNKLSEISDSVATALVFNSIIQNGDNKGYAQTDFEEGALGMTNMNDRFITISFDNDSVGKTLIFVNTDSRVVESSEDEEIENGYVHTIDKVLSPSNASVADLVMIAENTRIFGEMLEKTGWDKKLQKVQDEAWYDYWVENGDIPGSTKAIPGKDFNPHYPEKRLFGHTIFVETDSVFQANGINNIHDLKTWLQANATFDDDTNQGHTTDWTDEHFTDDYNWLNQFVAYHILPERLTYNHLVNFANEYGCTPSSLKSRLATQFYVNAWEYWETMGVQRRSVKVTGIRGAKMLNRVSVYNKTTYKERTAEITIPGIKINSENYAKGKKINNQALNGFYYPIDGILVWNETVSKKVLNERMRYDVTSLFPEYMTNNIRQYGHEDRSHNWIVTPDYCDNIYNMSKETYFTYLVNGSYSGSSGSWMNYQIDEMNITGVLDFTMKLPPVPYTGTYEIRYGINSNDNRGMAQVYVGTNKDNLPAIGIPLDLRQSSGVAATATGWVDDANLGDEDAINENDKAMRNLGFMKAPKYMQFENGKTGRDVDYRCVRKIIYMGQLEAGKTYWIRFKSVLANSGAEFFYDYLELVPKSVYAGEEAEDKW